MTGFSMALGSDHEAQSKQRWKGTAYIKGPAWTHMPSITVCLLGVQIFWSVEMAYASPYLISLGLSKSLMALVFVAGPLSGLVMQPLIGVLADNSRSRWGRRRPYMLGSTILSIFAMFLLGFTRQFSNVFTAVKSRANDILTIWLAIVAIYFIDFAINAVQALNRALLVDTLPTAAQASGNAWAARMLGIGSVMGFFVGSLGLPELFPFLGKTQLQVLAVLASLLLLGFQSLTAACVEEKVLLDDSSPKKTFMQEIREIVKNMRTLPRTIRQICYIQFFAWIGWFPVIFYTTTYVGDIHKRQFPLRILPTAPEYADALAALDATATRLGSRALLLSSLIALATNIILPFFVAGARTRKPGGRSNLESPLGSAGLPSDTPTGWSAQFQVHLATMWAASHFLFAACMMATLFTSSVFGSTVLLAITGFSWAITQWAPFSLLAEAILTSSAQGSTTAIRLEDARTPVSAPVDDERRQFLVGDDDEDDDEDREPETTDKIMSKDSPRASAEERDRDVGGGGNGYVRQHRQGQESVGSLMGNSGAQISRIDVSASFERDDDEDDYEGYGDRGSSSSGGGLSAKAGVILGIHNIFVVIPQFLVTALSSIIFAVLEPHKSVLHGTHPHPGSASPAIPVHPTNGTTSSLIDAANNVASNITDAVAALGEMVSEEVATESAPNSVGIIFRIGGVSAMVAFVLCWRLARELKHP